MVKNRFARIVWGLLCVCLCLPAAGAAEEKEGAESAVDRVWSELVNGGSWGKLSLDARLRLELAEMDNLDASQAFTLRARLGYGTPVWRGFSAFVEGEGVLPFNDDYFNAVGSQDGRTVIADPNVLQLNRAFAKYEAPETRTQVVAGRQRIILDDARFIGNVGWRQNEQTFDSASFGTGLGVDDLDVYYSYLFEVHRIFGDHKTGAPGTRDFDVHAHVANVSYAIAPELDATLFGYLLDFQDAAAFGFSSNSYGARITGSHACSDEVSVGYQLSYALQTDTGENPVDYIAHYVLADANVGFAPIGTAGAGYELLGSDDGKARFVTPLATLHKFNGWADVFLDNGGVRGLQDLYFYVAPRLPLGLKGRFVFHQFWSHEGGTNLGSEYDAVLSKAVNQYLTILTKGAVFDATEAARTAANPKRDIWRFWLQATLAF